MDTIWLSGALSRHLRKGAANDSLTNGIFQGVADEHEIAIKLVLSDCARQPGRTLSILSRVDERGAFARFAVISR